MRKVLVVGGLAAGPAAALSAVREGADVTLIEAGPAIAYGICELPHLVSGEVSDAGALEPHTPARFERERGVRVLAGHRVIAIRTAPGRALVQPDRGEPLEIPFDAVVLATGSRPRVPAAGAARALKTLDDARFVRDAAVAAGPGARAAVLGGGYIGLLAVAALVRRGLRVTLFEREEAPLGGFEDGARGIVTSALADAGVELRAGVNVETGAVEGAVVVVAALGADPVTELARACGAELGTSGGVRVDERSETTVRGVFAAGDCAECPEAIAGLRAPVGLATVANRMGHVAGANAAGGRSARLVATVRPLVFQALGLEIGRMGLSSDEARAAGLEVQVTSVIGRSVAAPLGEGEPLLVTLVVDRPTGKLVGANLIGASGAALRLNQLAVLAQRGVTAAEIADMDVGYAPFLGPLVDPLRQAGRRAERERR